jgi:hypothetical protein
MTAECPSRYGGFSWCRLPQGHDGLHTNTVIEWDDEAAQKSGDATVKQMRGRTE